ncbi:hypothetical protein CWB96_05390 [Pseudoalteromonas citrea]|uniref:Uncharacterized protein n=2 Tax=Pseudoalteromonas TaxID=53246 RepID=A0A5S3UVJ4_9GAMM|nr:MULTISPECIES: hypothetical protein [Pseudoalteromonas]TMO56840.1 hypothetical protein CWC18_19075 [Pseudoalteromonas aurantia]TMO61425.1 hypothetical protein CWC19_20845 [Pseudoalteromonas aurantia]TMO71490.1 hypothetical protein CWC20_17445 [Pseudoalteromonas aurantia]TMP42853.1 hypothetical protein CWB97_10565 [Pseudoalteromonas citrea]TMP61059.1 hypothetical protein CWB96_05390 [Pseudoalteromonas citrea]
MTLSHQHLRYSNTALATFLLLFIVSVLMSYPLAHHLTLPAQVVSHISSIVLAGLFKLSYVLRCVCQYQLNMEVR